MPLASQSKQIIEESMVKGIKNTFILGCTESRVTFNSQQIRAFNLIWALFDQKVIDKNSKVGIVGGGLSGMTAAAALHLKECDVTLFHESDELMDMQRGNLSRFIHPNIYDWPHAGCEIDYTNLPCLNWCAGNAEEVAMQIEDHWKELGSSISVRLNTRIEKVEFNYRKTRVYIADSADNEPFDCVILAVGFGFEKTLPNTQTRSYWDNDNIAQSNRTRSIKAFLISGCGDGGLIDALRARLVNFKHGDFTRSLLAESELQKLKDQLIEIEKTAPKDPEEFSNYVFDSYKTLNIPSSLSDYIKSQLRSKTKVILNGRLSTAMSSKACLINRFCIYLLVNLNEIIYTRGEIDSAVFLGGKFQVEIKEGDRSKMVECDELIIRHGPKPILKELIGESELPDTNKSLAIVSQLWEKGFYPETTEEMNHTSEAYRNLEAFQKKIKKIDPKAMICVEQQKGAQIYAVYSLKYKDNDLSSIADFKGVKVRLSDLPVTSLTYSSHLNIKSATLSPGASIGAGDGNFGTLGCFVYTDNRKIGFVSTGHLFQSKSLSNIYFQNGQSQDGVLIGKLYKSVVLAPSVNNKRTKNVVDAAVGLLNPGIDFQRSVTTENYEIKLKGAGIARIGDLVMKFGAETGLTKGEVKALHCSLTINQHDKEYYFEEAIMIKSISNQPFAKTGDSGAVVYKSDGRILGIVFATSADFTVICPIKEVLESLNCSLLPS